MTVRQAVGARAWGGLGRRVKVVSVVGWFGIGDRGNAKQKLRGSWMVRGRRRVGFDNLVNIWVDTVTHNVGSRGKKRGRGCLEYLSNQL